MRYSRITMPPMMPPEASRLFGPPALQDYEARQESLFDEYCIAYAREITCAERLSDIELEARYDAAKFVREQRRRAA